MSWLCPFADWPLAFRSFPETCLAFLLKHNCQLLPCRLEIIATKLKNEIPFQVVILFSHTYSIVLKVGLCAVFLFLYLFILLAGEVNVHVWRDVVALCAALWLCLLKDRGDRNQPVRSRHLLSLSWEVRCQPAAWKPLAPSRDFSIHIQRPGRNP